MQKLLSRPAAILACGLLIGPPVFAGPLPEPFNRPQRVEHGAPAATPSRPDGGAAPNAGPLVVEQGHEEPEVFSLSVPMNHSIEKYLEKYTSPVWLTWLNKVLRRARPFLGFISSRIRAFDLPRELLYLPIAESSYDPFAVSKVGAAGLWQLMTITGHAHKLEINSWVDQRFDFRKATDASLETLKEDHSALGDWLLALAAYDAGLGFMQSVIARTGIHDYWTLAADGYLPRETVDYVPRFLALAAICSYPGRYGLPATWDKPVEWARVDLPTPVDIRLLAEEAKISRHLLSEGNAGLKREVTPPSGDARYLNVPKDDAAAVKALIHGPKDNLLRFYIYVVRKGDTIFSLARHYGVPVSMILQYNPGLSPADVPVGKELLIPAVNDVGPYHPPKPRLRAASSDEAGTYPAHAGKSSTILYTVEKGDTLWSIARQWGTIPSKIAEANDIDPTGVIHPGLVLRIPKG